MAATMKPSVTDGPAQLAAAAAVRTKRPAPMIAPMPSPTSDVALSVRDSPFSELSASSRSCFRGFRTQRFAMEVPTGVSHLGHDEAPRDEPQEARRRDLR